jgi:hypothetical protein
MHKARKIEVLAQIWKFREGLTKGVTFSKQEDQFLLETGYITYDENGVKLTPKGFNSLQSDPRSVSNKELSRRVRAGLTELHTRGLLEMTFELGDDSTRYFKHFDDSVTIAIFAALGVVTNLSKEEVLMEAPTDEVIIQLQDEQEVEVEKTATKKSRKKV